MEAASIPWDGLRAEIERRASDLADPARTARELDTLRDGLVDLLGVCDTYTASVAKYREAEARVAQETVSLAYDAALYREEVLHKGEATALELDEQGIYSREELDRLAEEGLLEEAVRHFDTRLHPHDRTGRFSRTFTNKRKAYVRPTSVGGHHAAVGPRGEYIVRPTEQEARAAATMIDKAEADAKKPAAGKGKAGLGDPGVASVPDVRDVPNEPFARDPKLVQQARSMILSGEPTTRDKYARERKGRLVYDKSREQVHRHIIETLIGDVKPPKGRKPQLFLTGGGFASGKGGIVDGFDGHAAHEWKPEHAVTIDPDKVKALLPEFGELTKAGDPEANLRTYEEAWDVSQALAAEVRKRGLDVIVDGVGNTSADEVMGRIKSYTDAGYDEPKAVYVSKDAFEAIKDAEGRMTRAIESGKLESIRYIPPDLMLDVHSNVSKVFPSILERWPGELELYHTEPRQPDGSFLPPVKMLEKRGGKVKIIDQKRYDAFLAKADLA